MTPIGIHGEKSYHLTTTKTPRGDMSYGRIKFADCVHHYIVYGDTGCYGVCVEVYDLKGNLLELGDMMDCPDVNRRPASKNWAITFAKALVEDHLNDDVPLWTPSGYTTSSEGYL